MANNRNLKKIALQIVCWSAIAGIFILVVGLTTIGVRNAYHLGYQIFSDEPYDKHNTKEVVVSVPEGCSMWVMAQSLKEEGFIADEIVFYGQALLYGYELAVGEHVISPSMTGAEILKELSAIEIANEDK